MVKRFKLIVLLLSVHMLSYAYDGIDNIHNHIVPPDSSSSLVDRAAARLLIDEGKQLLNQGKTRDALTKFRQAYVRDKYSSRAAYWVGRAHYNLTNYGYALQYAKVSESLSQAADGEVFYLLGQAYHRKNELDSARMNYDLAKIQLSRQKNAAYRIDELIAQVAFAKKMTDVEINFVKEFIPGEVNSGYSDYSPVLAPNHKELYFVSRRPDTKGGGINPSDQNYFEDIYRAKWNESLQVWDSVTNDLERLNTDGFDAISHITEDGQTIYLTLNTTVLDISNTTAGSDIATSTMTNQGRWSKPKPIKHSQRKRSRQINTSYFEGGATLTADENTMYFISDRNAERSMMDIFVVHREGKKWGEVRPLPSNVNSLGNETTPYITPDGQYLFFSSDGFEGMGGYDIYVTKNLGDGKWSDPINLGPEFNTVNNDTHFRYYEDLARAYFSSFRLQDNKSSIDIFQIDLTGWEIPQPPKKEEKE